MSFELDSSVPATPGDGATSTSGPSPPPVIQDAQAMVHHPTHQPVSKPPAPSAMPSIPEARPRFSWTEPHARFVVILVGPDETPFGIQKDFLCAQSAHYRKLFSKQNVDNLESVVKLPDTPEEVFGLAQHFMYTGLVFPEDAEMPSYEALVSVWKLGQELGIQGLCERTLETMIEVRDATGRIPGAPLLVRVWRETPEGSAIRVLLLAWASEYMRSSESNAEFAKSLPQEVLSELVLAMSRPDTTPLVQLGMDDRTTPTTILTPTTINPAQSRRKTVHYIDEEHEQADSESFFLSNKKQRRPEPLVNGNNSKAAARKAKSAALAKAVPRRRPSSSANGEPQDFTDEQKLLFCQDLLLRMLSGPGFWTRLVGPFREPVDPVRDNVPDYHEKVTKPMDLITMKAKMDGNEYTSHEQFLADMNLIFTNCKTYWKPGQGVYLACEKLEKTFMDKYSGMSKWLAKMEGNEDH